MMKNTQTEMGKVSNLITDMTLKGANQEEIAKAVRHSMVVIDAEKHKLDYKQSEIDNDIAALKKKWQGSYDNPHVSIWYYKLDSMDEVAYPEMWVKANPNLGKTVSYETYQLDVERAEKAPAARNDILAKRFGIPMEGYTYYFTYEETLPHRPRTYWQMACSLGCDLSQGDDFMLQLTNLRRQ